MLKFVLILGVCFTVSGCITPRRTLTPAELPRVPQSEGVYAGNTSFGSPWIYLGSDVRFHFFSYTYTRGSTLNYINIRVSKSQLTLPFEQSKKDVPDQGITVEVIFNEKTGYGFAKKRYPSEADSAWLLFSQKPQFDFPPVPLPEPSPLKLK